jgi:hypothetical protein
MTADMINGDSIIDENSKARLKELVDETILLASRPK